MEATKITIHATISAGIQKVWNYYTQPEHITKWNFASPDWHCPSASNDMRIGGKYNDNWHFNHMWSPQRMDEKSVMPAYKWLFDNKAMDISDIEKKMSVMVTLGVPYTDADIANAKKSIETQSAQIEKNLHNDPDFVKSYEDSKKKAAAKGETFVPMKDREIVALIAYLQRMGTDIKVKKAE